MIPFFYRVTSQPSTCSLFSFHFFFALLCLFMYKIVVFFFRSVVDLLCMKSLMREQRCSPYQPSNERIFRKTAKGWGKERKRERESARETNRELSFNSNNNCYRCTFRIENNSQIIFCVEMHRNWVKCTT